MQRPTDTYFLVYLGELQPAHPSRMMLDSIPLLWRKSESCQNKMDILCHFYQEKTKKWIKPTCDRKVPIQDGVSDHHQRFFQTGVHKGHHNLVPRELLQGHLPSNRLCNLSLCPLVISHCDQGCSFQNIWHEPSHSVCWDFPYLTLSHLAKGYSCERIYSCCWALLFHYSPATLK